MTKSDEIMLKSEKNLDKKQKKKKVIYKTAGSRSKNAPTKVWSILENN